jgi:outer membrane receptor protein involved in Fe transport
MFGSYGRQRHTINTSGPLGKFDYYLHYGNEQEDGYRNGSDATLSRFFGKIGYRPTDKTDLNVSYTYVKDHLGQAGSLPLGIATVAPRTNFTPGDYSDAETNVVRFNGRQVLPFGFTANLNAFYRQLSSELFTVSQPFDAQITSLPFPTSRNLVRTESRGETGQLTHASAPLGHKNLLVVGQEFTKNDLGQRRGQQSTFFGVTTPSNTQGTTDELIHAYYVQDTFNITEQLLLTAGARYDRNQINFSDKSTPANSGVRTFSRTNPRAGLTYLVTPTSSVFVNYSEGFRVPTSNELFALGAFGSNPNLRPMKTRNYEIGGRTQLGPSADVSLSFFQIDARDEILLVCGDPVTCGVSTFTSNQNVDRTRRRGIETTWRARFNRYVDTTLNYTYTEATFRTTATLNPFFFDPFGATPYVENVQKGDSLPLVPKHRLSLVTNIHPAEGWTVTVTGLYVSSQYYLNDNQNVQSRIPSYFVLGSRVAYERKVPGGRLAGFLMMNNMLDTKYFTQGIIAANNVNGNGGVTQFVVPAPGITVFGGLSYRFESPI